MSVHPSAVVAAGARLAPGARVGPFCVVGAEARLGPGTQLLAHAVVLGDTELAADCVVHPFACLGGAPQIAGGGRPGRLRVGEGCVLREGVTLSLGSHDGDGETRLGAGCMLMAHAHVGHDGHLGDAVVLANHVLLAGHVEVGERAQIGGGAAVQQHCRIGRLAFVGGGAMVAQDVPPFTIAQGDRAQLAGLNLVGLRRSDVAATRRQALWRAYRLLWGGETARALALAQLAESTAPAHPEVAELVRFVASSRRGVAGRRARAGGRSAAGEDVWQERAHGG